MVKTRGRFQAIRMKEISEEGGDSMSRLKNHAVRPGLAIVGLLTVMVLSGCALSIKYNYDVQASFPELKTYRWIPSSGVARQDHLVEANVQFFADRDLGSKGMTRNTDQTDLLVWMDYDFAHGKNYQLEALTIYIARADNRQVIWRGTASGSIGTDAGSKELEGVVTGILTSFPPK